MSLYFRPMPLLGPAPGDLPRLAGGLCAFETVEVLSRDAAPRLVPWRDLPDAVLQRLTAPRPALAGIALDRPRLMGIVNVTPDSFSDGGRFLAAEPAIAHGRGMVADGADLLDIGGESTRPGATPVAPADEAARVLPVIAGLAGTVPLSVDTRNAATARAALAAGAGIVNDVSAGLHDPAMLRAMADSGAPVVLMHAQGDPQVMQRDPRYADVLLDVYDHLAARLAAAEAAGIPRARIVLDPGIGFGKTGAHNLALLARLSLFHGLGCALLVGASRKRFIGVIGGAPDPADRAPGSVAVALAAAAQGVQILRVHDMPQTRQALALWLAATAGVPTKED